MVCPPPLYKQWTDTSYPCVVYCGVPTSPLQTMDRLAAHVLYIMVCPPPFTNSGHTSYPCVEYCGLSTSLFTNSGRTLTTHVLYVVDYPPPPPFILWFVHLPLYKQWTHQLPMCCMWWIVPLLPPFIWWFIPLPLQAVDDRHQLSMCGMWWFVHLLPPLYMVVYPPSSFTSSAHTLATHVCWIIPLLPPYIWWFIPPLLLQTVGRHQLSLCGICYYWHNIQCTDITFILKL